MKKSNGTLLLASLAISLGAGALSRILTSGSMEQYETLYKPPLAPPGWLFPIVWTILFILMGIAAYLVARQGGEGSREALALYLIQLLANVAWSVIFFRFEAYLLAFAWLLLLWYLILITIQHFAPISRTAALLMLPYLLWVTFAGYLNLAIALSEMSFWS